MKIVHIEIRNFRGIAKMDWSPEPGVNCLIGPGDSTKTTVLDAIEFALNPRSNFVGDDTDFYDLVFQAPVTITLTLTGFPAEFSADNRYGLHLRGWDETHKKLIDEPGDGLQDALSIRVTIDPETLEARWSLFNERVDGEDNDPPSLRYKDARELATTRLGPYAERHLGWGRQSILNRLGDGGSMSSQLALASRAAREAFRASNKDVFAQATMRAEKLGKHFAVTVRDKYAAELDVQGSVITAGGVALHDGKLPLRTLGTGSARLIVSALQHNAGGSHIALVDEIEHGLEPHRIARLLKYLRTPPVDEDGKPATGPSPQVFITTHSPVVIRELDAKEIMAVRSKGGVTSVASVASTAKDLDVAQRHLRSSPDAFLARRVLVGEGKTECGLMRGLDSCWTDAGKESFAYQGVVAINGEGIPKALQISEHLLDLGYEVVAVLDSDQPPSQEQVDALKAKGGKVLIWPGACSVEQRMFLDVPWATVKKLVAYAVECQGQDRVLATIKNATPDGIGVVSDLGLPPALDTSDFRAVLGLAAKTKDKAWFKDIGRGEQIAALVFDCLGQISGTPFATILSETRTWVDG